MKQNVLVFDVESTSLHGTAFAVGAVVANRKGELLDEFLLVSNESISLANDWVKENVIPNLRGIYRCDTDKGLREYFYKFYMKYKETSEIWSDCNFPVETNFLSEVVKDDLINREFQMPYPLKDISTIVDISIDRYEFYKLHGDKRNIMFKHNPLYDAIASLFILQNYQKHDFRQLH